MFDFNSYCNSLKELKLKNKRLQSNCFLGLNELKELSVKDNSRLVTFDDGMAIVVDEGSFMRLYFHLCSLSDINLLESLSKQFDKDIIAEIIGTVEGTKQIHEWLEQNGAKEYSVLERFRAAKLDLVDETDNGDFVFNQAGEADITPIMDMFSCTFDERVSHLPDYAALKVLVDQNLVFCARKQDDIAAVVCLERVGKNGLYLYQIAVNKDYRNHGLGIKIGKFAFGSFDDCKSYVSWVETDNEGSQRLHKRLGFRGDGIMTRIMFYGRN